MLRNPSMSFLLRVATSKRVVCDPVPYGCGAPIGEQCRNMTPGPKFGRPLGGFGAHVARFNRAQTAQNHPTEHLELLDA